MDLATHILVYGPNPGPEEGQIYLDRLKLLNAQQDLRIQVGNEIIAYESIDETPADKAVENAQIAADEA